MKVFIILSIVVLLMGVSSILSKNKVCFTSFVIFLTLTFVMSVVCWEMRWPLFVVWGEIFFLSFTQTMEEESKKDVKIVFLLSLIGLCVTGNVLGLRYGLMWMFYIVSIVEFFTILSFCVGLFGNTNKVPSEYYSEM